MILPGLDAAPSLALANQATFALAAGQPRDVAAAATLLIRVCTLWFGVALGALALVCLSGLSARANQQPEVTALTPEPRARSAAFV